MLAFVSTSVGVRDAALQRHVRRRTASWVEPVGRIGLVTQGVLYAVVGLLALQVASGRSDERADQHGAIQSVSDQPFGRALLVLLAAGLALHCVWRLVLAARGDGNGDDAKAAAKRVGQAGRAALYGGFTVAAIKVLMDAPAAGGGDTREATSHALDWPAGDLVLIAVGIAVIGTGLWHGSKVITQSFRDDLDLPARSPMVCRLVTVLGAVGYFARGVVFTMVGWFLVQAAVQHDPNESGGLDSALKRLSASEHGPGLLRLLAIGLFAFGVYRVVDGCLRTREAIANA